MTKLQAIALGIGWALLVAGLFLLAYVVWTYRHWIIGGIVVLGLLVALAAQGYYCAYGHYPQWYHTLEKMMEEESA